MKSPALNRVLEKSTAETLAALSVGAFFRADNAELNRIYGALPCHGQAWSLISPAIIQPAMAWASIIISPIPSCLPMPMLIC